MENFIPNFLCTVFNCFLVFSLLQASAFKITLVGNRSEVGEAPFWNEDEQLLYYVDMTANLLMTYDPISGVSHTAKVDSDRSPLTVVLRVKASRNHYVISLKGSLAVVRWDGRGNRTLTPKYFTELLDPSGSDLLNDGKASPQNYLWIGSRGGLLTSNPITYERNKGKLFSIDKYGYSKLQLDETQLSNGLEWSLQGDKFYFIDSLEYKVFQFNYNRHERSISNKTVVFDLKANGLLKDMNSAPDGMTIDNKGKLWVAVFGSQKVIRIDPVSGKLLREIRIPEVLQPTSVAFGGLNLDILFVTSAREFWTQDLEARYPQSGKLIAITELGVCGLPSRDVELDRRIWSDVKN